LAQVFARKLIPLQRAPTENRTAENELRVMAKIAGHNHRNIITVFKYGEFPDLTHAFIDMDLCDMNLDEYNKASWTVALIHKGSEHETRTWKITSEIAGGLQFIHEQGEIHRDLKPSNGYLRFGHLLTSQSYIPGRMNHGSWQILGSHQS
jgi:serine/threonine protein kinase